MSGLPDTARTKPRRRTAAPWHATLAAALIVVAVAIFVIAGGDENPKPAEGVHAGVEDIAVGTEDVPFPRSDTSRFDAGTPAVRVYPRVRDVPVAGRMVATVEHSGRATAFGALFGEPDVRAEDGGEGRLSVSEEGSSGVVSFVVRGAAGKYFVIGDPHD